MLSKRIVQWMRFFKCRGHGLWMRMRKATRDEQSKRVLCVFAVCLFVMCIPLFSRQLPIGDDYEYQLMRIEGIKDGLLSGQFPVRVDPLFFNGYGYGSPLFYPDLLLYFPATLRLIGFSLSASCKAFLASMAALCWCTAYACGKGIAKSRNAGMAVGVVFCLSQYFLQNLYSRFALGEVQALAFLPLIVYGLYDFLYGEYERPYLMIAGFSGLLFCHLLTAAIAFFICTALSVLRIRHLVLNPQKLKRLLLSALAVAGITAVFWLPFFEQLQTGSFYIDPHKVVGDMAVSVPVMFSNSYTLSYGNCTFGISLLLLCVARIFLENKEGTRAVFKLLDKSMLIGLCLLFLSSNLFAWNALPKFFNYLQFPWRLYAPAALFLAISVGLMVALLANGQREKLILFVLLVFMCASAVDVIANSARYITIDGGHFQNAANTYPGNGYEYLPEPLDAESIRTLTMGERNVVTNSGNFLSYTDRGNSLSIRFSERFEYIDVPLLYYKGYSAMFIDADGTRIPLMIENYSHKVRVFAGSLLESGTIELAYTGTTAQAISVIVSPLSLLASLAYIKAIRSKKANKTAELKKAA